MCLISYFIGKQTRSFRKGKRCVSVNFFFISVHKKKKEKKKRKKGKKRFRPPPEFELTTSDILGERLLYCATVTYDGIMVKHIQYIPFDKEKDCIGMCTAFPL